MKLHPRRSKGMGIELVFFAISMTAIIAGLAAFAQAQQLPPAFGQTVDELGSVTKPEHRLEDTINHYIPLSAHYAVAEAAYNTSTNNTNFTGHADSHVSTGPTEEDNDADETQRYRQMIDYVDTRSQSYFEQYIRKLDYDDCSIRMFEGAKVNLSYSSTQVEVRSGFLRPLINVSCQTPELDIYTESKLNRKLSLNMSNLRFHELASITVNTTHEMEQVSETLESNGKHYSSVTSSSVCSFEEDEFSSISEAKSAAEDAAYARAVNDAYAKVDDFEAAIVEKRHGYEGDNRGAKKVLKDATTSNAFCVFGFCLTKFWTDDISYDAYVKDNETSVTRASSSSSQCGCAKFACNQDPDGDYSYTLPDSQSGGKCVHDRESSVGSNPYSADCSHEDGDASDGNCTQGDYSGDRPSPSCPAGYSYNATSGQCEDGAGGTTSRTCTDSTDNDNDNDWDYNGMDSCDWVDGTFGSPSCSEEDFVHDGDGGCKLNEEDSISDSSEGRPDRQCVNKKYSAEATVDYEYERIEVQLNLTDDKFVIPTSDGFTNLYMNRKFIRNFEEPPP